MKYCSKCGGEYLDWVTGCADCGCTEFITAAEMRRHRLLEKGGDAFVCVETLEDGMLAGKLAGLLEGSGIAVFLDPPAGASTGRWNVLVRKSQEAQANELIDKERAGRDLRKPTSAALRRTEALCALILDELQRGPRILRQVAHRPEQRVESLLQACHLLAARERDVEARVTPAEMRRLEGERAELLRQREAADDPIVTECLSTALSSLDEQLRHRKEILMTAKRLEAEQTRIYYELENFYTELLELRSTHDASTELAAADSRRGLQQLSAEVKAVADALQEANHGEDSVLPPGTSCDAEQSGSDAERHSEAGRAK